MSQIKFVERWQTRINFHLEQMKVSSTPLEYLRNADNIRRIIDYMEDTPYGKEE